MAQTDMVGAISACDAALRGDEMDDADMLIAQSIESGECIEADVGSESDDLCDELEAQCDISKHIVAGEGRMDSVLYSGRTSEGEWSVRVYLEDSK